MTSCARPSSGWRRRSTYPLPVVRAADAVVHDLHGSRFTSYAAPARGSTELRAWRLDVPRPGCDTERPPNRGIPAGPMP
jgi:hypothetical protein